MAIYFTDLQREALIKLLKQPDPPDIIRRYHYTCAGASNKDEIKHNLGTAYVTHRRQDAGQDISCVISVRRRPLKLVRRA